MSTANEHSITYERILVLKFPEKSFSTATVTDSSISYEVGCSLSKPVKASLDQAIAEVLHELERLGVGRRRREHPAEHGIWWTTDEKMESPLAT